MNQRIAKLANQVWVDNDQLDACGYTDLEKFAELIVQECIEVANKNRTGMEIKSNTHLTADAIKQHFGVEE